MRRRLNMFVIHLAVLVSFVGFNNCSGFAPPEINSIVASSQSDSSPAPSGKKVSAFVATGHMGRTVLSCDGGVSWIHDQSQDDEVRCWTTGHPKNVECDHTPYSNSGATFGGGYFYASFGWGYPGTVRRSSDGVNWEIIRSNEWGGGLAYVNGNLYWRGGTWQLSSDQGTTWSNVTPTNFSIYDIAHPRPVALDNRLLIVARDPNAVNLAVSSDGGQTLTPTAYDTHLGGSFASNNLGLFVSLAKFERPDKTKTPGLIARSTDGGVTWTPSTVSGIMGQWTSNILFDGSQFVAFADNKKWTSTDGLQWVGTLMNTAWFGPSSYDSVKGKYAVITGNWGSTYANQKAYQSSDGINWTLLTSNQFKGGHPIRQLVLGEVDEEVCQTTTP